MAMFNLELSFFLSILLRFETPIRPKYLPGAPQVSRDLNLDFLLSLFLSVRLGVGILGMMAYFYFFILPGRGGGFIYLFINNYKS